MARKKFNHGKDKTKEEQQNKKQQKTNESEEIRLNKGKVEEEPGQNKGEVTIEKLKESIACLEEENKQLKEQLLRKQADYENFRKRLFREKEESIRYANQMLLLDMVAIIDDFERAIKSADESNDFSAFHDGIVIIEKQLTSMLEKKWGLKRFDSLNEAFDPAKHQAIALEESEKYDAPTVVEDYQKGYFFHERVLRPSKVKVCQPLADSKPVTSEPADSGPAGSQASADIESNQEKHKNNPEANSDENNQKE